jgi:hypothetical protein
MWADYAEVSDEVTLDPDDTAGICALHPPDPDAANDDCSPRHGFHSACGGRTPTVSGGCALAAPNVAGQTVWLAALAGLGLARLARSRRR